MGGAAAARRRLRHQLVALLPAPVASAAAPLGTPPMAEVAPEHEIEAAAMQYHRSGYTILRDAVPAELLRDLQRRFDGHAEAHVQSLGPELPRGRLTFYELNEGAVLCCFSANSRLFPTDSGRIRRRRGVRTAGGAADEPSGACPLRRAVMAASSRS